MKFLKRSSRLPEERSKRPLVDFRWVSDFNVPHVLPLALKQSLRILQESPVKEAELHIVRIRVNVGDGAFFAHPATVSPLHGFAQPRFNAVHKLPQLPDDRLIPGALPRKI